jgi:hypothetical protein
MDYRSKPDALGPDIACATGTLASMLKKRIESPLVVLIIATSMPGLFGKFHVIQHDKRTAMKHGDASLPGNSS